MRLNPANTRHALPHRRVGKQMKRLVSRALREESGQDLIEYAMLAAFISLIATASITSIGTMINAWYEDYAGQIDKIPG
jgi:Flp pilus assembly pilin Flp